MGLIGGMARTAVIAGAATAVGNRVSRRQANRWAQMDQAAAYQQEQQYGQPQYAQPQYPQRQYAQPQYAQPAPAPGSIAQIKSLAELKDQGILTEEEFSAQKAKSLGL
jgi:Short C-terminal domain